MWLALMSISHSLPAAAAAAGRYGNSVGMMSSSSSSVAGCAGVFYQLPPARTTLYCQSLYSLFSVHWTLSVTSALFLCAHLWLCFCAFAAPCGLRVERTDPLRFLAGCRKRWLNQALSVLFLNLGFLIVSVITRTNFCVVLFCVVCVFYLLVVLVRLSVSVQMIDWKDSSLKWPVMCWWGC